MLIEQALLTKLKATSSISGSVGDRIYLNLAPQDVKKPYLVITKVSGYREAMNNASTSAVATPRFQISCFAETYKAAKDLADAIRIALERFTGIMGGVGGVTVLAIHQEGEQDLYEPETRLHHVPVDFVVTHTESLT